jgi:hypothetical protein
MNRKFQNDIVKSILLSISRKSLSEIENKIKNARHADKSSRAEYQKILQEINKVKSLINRILVQIEQDNQ